MFNTIKLGLREVSDPGSVSYNKNIVHEKKENGVFCYVNTSRSQNGMLTCSFKYKELQERIYNHVYIGDIRELLDELPHYDLILFGDVIEHFEKQEELDLVQRCYKKLTRLFSS